MVFEEVGKASATAVGSAWATQGRNGPRVRLVHPTWEGDVLDYDLKDFYRDGLADPNYLAVNVTPTRVELSEMFGSVNQRVWRA